MSKFANNLEDLAERTAEYIRILEEENLRLKEEKNYFLHKAGENIAEIAELQAENAMLQLSNAELKANLKRCVSVMLDSEEQVQQYRKDIDFLLSKRNQGE